MPLFLKEGDITRFPADAVVNAANSSLLGGGGVDGAIHRAAGPELLKECMTLGGCETGRAKKTGGYAMPCRYIIHTVGPVWEGGKEGEPELLASCYRESLRLAEEAGCETVAFPLISSGAYGYPPKQAWEVARKAILDYLSSSEADLTVTMVVLSRRMFLPGEDLLRGLEVRNESVPIKRSDDREKRAGGSGGLFKKAARRLDPVGSAPEELMYACAARMEENAFESCDDADLDGRLKTLDESFSDMVLRKIDESGMTDAQCYKKANIDRKLFSKIRSNRMYRPSKQTALALAFALRLPRNEAEDLLRKAGFALSNSVVFDVVIGYFLDRGEYDLFVVNDALFAYDQPLLGG